MRNKSDPAVTKLTTWLTTQNFSINPSVKINGVVFPNAVLVVDFGSPLEPVRLTNDQGNELSGLIKDAVASITGKRNVRINFDNGNGIFWANISYA